MTTAYSPTNKRILDLMASNARVDDLLDNCTSAGANALLDTATSTGTNSTLADSLAGNVTDKTDGWSWVPYWRCGVTATTAPTATRNAVGDYSLNRTAGGAETLYFFATPTVPARIAAGKGFKVTNVVAVYTLGVVDATSVDLVLNKTTYADTVAVAVAAHGGTLTYNASHDTAGERKASAGGSNPHVMVASAGTAAFQVTDLAVVTAELAVVLANTGTLKFYGFGFHLTTDYL